MAAKKSARRIADLSSRSAGRTTVVLAVDIERVSRVASTIAYGTDGA